MTAAGLYTRQWRAAQRRRGGCSNCWRVADASKSMCTRCLPKKRERNRRRRQRLVRAGLCVECGKEPRTSHRTLGEKCAMRKVDYYTNRKQENAHA